MIISTERRSPFESMHSLVVLIVCAATSSWSQVSKSEGLDTPIYRGEAHRCSGVPDQSPTIERLPRVLNSHRNSSSALLWLLGSRRNLVTMAEDGEMGMMWSDCTRKTPVCFSIKLFHHNIVIVLVSVPRYRHINPRPTILVANPATTEVAAANFPLPMPLNPVAFVAGPPITADSATNCMVATSSSIVFRIATCRSQIMTNAANSRKNKG